MKTLTYFEKGDIVEITADWRFWEKGDKARVTETSFESGGIKCNQLLRLEALGTRKAEQDFDWLYSYNVKIFSEQPNQLKEQLQEMLNKWDYSDPMSRAIHDLEDFIEKFKI